jgi:exopolysaccharide biosynthesis polyprenyl glycosylphosphotransferase
MNFPSKKTVFQYFCSAIISIVCLSVFFYTWFSFINSHDISAQLMYRSNLVLITGIYFVFYLFWMLSLGGFNFTIDRKMHVLISQVIALLVTDFLFVIVTLAIFAQYRLFGKILANYFLMWLVQSLVCVAISNMLISYSNRKFPPLEMVEVYGSHKNDVENKINARFEQYHIAEMISCDSEISQLREAIMKHESVLINDVPAEKENDILKLCFELDKRVYFSPKISDILIKSSKELNIFDTPFYLCTNSGLNSVQKFWKRFFDIVLSSVALIILSPLFLVVSISIKLEDGGPVFYKQERLTEGKRKFDIIKFRSMIVDAEKNGHPQLAGDVDPRITKVGKFIRATRIDELPQLINIIKGDMSIVGPRPEREAFYQKYSADVPEFWLRLKVKGGLTGYAQVYGKYNTTPLDKTKMDISYITNYSFLLDVRIVLETLKVIFYKESSEGFSDKEKKNIE